MADSVQTKPISQPSKQKQPLKESRPQQPDTTKSSPDSSLTLDTKGPDPSPSLASISSDSSSSASLTSSSTQNNPPASRPPTTSSKQQKSAPAGESSKDSGSSTKDPAPAATTKPASPSSPVDKDPGPAPLRRALSFKIPLKVNTEAANGSSSTSSTPNRSRASSAVSESNGNKVEKSATSPLHQRNRSKNVSLSSIGEVASPVPHQLPLPASPSSPPPQDSNPVVKVKDPEPAAAAAAAPSPTSSRSPTEQFLFDRGLLPEEPSQKIPSPLALQSVLQSQLTSYLATMSSQPAKTPSVEQVSPQQQYQQPPQNMRMAPMPQPGLPVAAPLPGLSGQANSVVGNLLKGPVGPNGQLKDAALMVGIKLDLEAEVHLTARVRGDIIVGLY
ncbi:hypothetical protein PspLS_01089 [Pyricularia sp. CBS 133598]|nr:hypothetical protein PspLS_01089 [Pyricularia sp. CBS 133598]